MMYYQNIPPASTGLFIYNVVTNNDYYYNYIEAEPVYCRRTIIKLIHRGQTNQSGLTMTKTPDLHHIKAPKRCDGINLMTKTA